MLLTYIVQNVAVGKCSNSDESESTQERPKLRKLSLARGKVLPESWYVTADAQAELRLACRGYCKLDMAEKETAIKRLDAAAEGWALEASHQ